MTPMRVLSAVSVTAFVGVALLAGCAGGGGSTSIAPAPTPAPVASATSASFNTSLTTAIAATSASTPIPVPLPTSNGFGGSLTLPAPTAATVALVQTRMTNLAPNDPGIPPVSIGRAPVSVRAVKDVAFSTLVYVRVTVDQPVSLPNAPAFTVSVPASALVPGATYFLAYFHGDKSLWDLGFEGPGVLNGTTVAFPANPAAFTFVPGTVYWFAMIAVPAVSATPSPQPSIVPSPTATPSPGPTSSPTAAPSNAPTNAPSGSPGASPSPSPSPTPTPTPTPAPTPQGALVAAPSSVTFFNSTAPQAVSISETKYTGAVTETDTCSGKATITGGGSGSAVPFSVTPIAVGLCSATFADSFGQTVTVPITVTTLAFPIK